MPSGCPVTPGFPIRRSPDQSLFDSSPRHIAAYHVLHRLSTPRHPPCALSNLTTLMRGCRKSPLNPHPLPTTRNACQPTRKRCSVCVQAVSFALKRFVSHFGHGRNPHEPTRPLESVALDPHTGPSLPPCRSSAESMNLHPPIRLSKSFADRAAGSIGTPSANALGARGAYRLRAARQPAWSVFFCTLARKNLAWANRQVITALEPRLADRQCLMPR